MMYIIDKDKDANGNIINFTINNHCSRCGSCCGLFIPFTEKELQVIKSYVKTNNIKPYNKRLNIETDAFEGNCCFYDKDNKKCMIYEVRPYVCRDFICSRKNWKTKRDMYEKRAKYNSSLSKKTILATFDDKIYDDVYPIMRYILSVVAEHQLKLGLKTDEINVGVLLTILDKSNRLDLLKYMEPSTEEEKLIIEKVAKERGISLK